MQMEQMIYGDAHGIRMFGTAGPYKCERPALSGEQ